MIENWNGNLNKKNKIGALFMDLSNAFDTLDHSLIIVKLEAYGFDCLSLTFIKIHLTNRKQICKVGNRFSIWRAITARVSQGLILGPLIFNIFTNELFQLAQNPYIDNKSQFSCEKSI